MASQYLPVNRIQIRAGFATIVLEALLVYAMVIVSAGTSAPKLNEALKVFNVTAVPDPPKVIERPIPHVVKLIAKHRPSSPAARKATASEIVAPVAVVPVEHLSVTVATSTPGVGTSSSTGTSAGGVGTGGGGQGAGGAGSKWPSLAEWRSGSVKDSDYPRAAWEAGIGGTVSVRYTVAATGHAVDCVVVRSSGNTELDTITCRLIERRFRFKPSRDERGRPVASLITEEHSWSVT